MNRRIRRLKDLLYPPHCVVCGELLPMKAWEGFLCEACEKHIPFCPEEVCPRCGGKTDTAGFCDWCRKPFAFSAVCAAFPYAAIRKSIHLYKYHGGKEMGDGLGNLMADYLLRCHEELLVKTDVIAGVPLHPEKEKQRGFNQTYILCERIAERTDLIFQKKALSRTRDTKPQSLLLPQERKENLRDAFVAEMDFSGKRVLLVDDIFTSGTTCRECAKAFYRAGAAEVFVFCLAAAGAKNADGQMIYEDAMDLSY